MKQEITLEMLKEEIENKKTPIHVLSKKTGRCAAYISKKIKEFGIKTPYCNLRNKQKQEIYEKILTYEFLSENFLKNGFSALYISLNIVPKDTPIAVSTIQRYARNLGIKTPNSSESAKSKQCQKMRSETNFKKFGETHPSKVESIKKQKREKAMSRYGVENVFQSDEIKEKSRNTLFKKYGTFNPSDLSKKFTGKRSRIHIMVEKLLEELNIKYISEASIFGKINTETNKFFSPIADILIEHLKIVIEVQGDIYHANPLIYKENDIIIKFGKPWKTAREIWNYDEIRKRHIESFGYKVFYIWQKDIVSNKQKTRNLINEYCKNIKNRENQ